MKYFLLIIPCVLSVWVPLYNSIEPTLAGIPFFFWFLLALIPVSSIFIWAASKIGGEDA